MFCSGQLGIGPNDDVPPDAREQADLCFSNIDAVLRDAGATPSHVVRVNAFVTGREHLPGAWPHAMCTSNPLSLPRFNLNGGVGVCPRSVLGGSRGHRRGS